MDYSLPEAIRVESDGPVRIVRLNRPEQLNAVVGMLDERGWQVMTHAIGDGAVRMTLDAYEAAAKANPAPERGRRHRIEHIETIDPADVPRFARLGVIASMQPVHATPSPEPGGVWNAYIRMTGVRKLYESVRDRPFIKMTLRRQPYGDWEFEVVDPNGYVLVFGGDETVAEGG